MKKSAKKVLANPDEYMVIDISGGLKVKNFPVSFLKECPKDGWSDEYKTTKILLKRIPAGRLPIESTRFGIEVEQFHLRNECEISSFYLGVFQVTQLQYYFLTGKNPSFYQGDMRPVENVSYDDLRGNKLGAQWPQSNAVDADSAIAIIRKKTRIEGFDLPTEAQWEYACRAGVKTNLNNGHNINECAQKSKWAASVARYNGTIKDGRGGQWEEHTTVGMYDPNQWGIYDMHGNVEEWVLDWMSDYSTVKETVKETLVFATSVAKGLFGVFKGALKGFPVEAQPEEDLRKVQVFNDPCGEGKGKERILKGGSFYSDAGGLIIEGLMGKRIGI